MRGSPYVYPLYRICANISIIDKVVKVIIIFPRPEYRLKGEKTKKKEVKEFICMYKKPRTSSRERAALTQYDREGFEKPRFQKPSTLCDQSTEKESKIREKFREKECSPRGKIQKGENEEYWI